MPSTLDLHSRRLRPRSQWKSACLGLALTCVTGLVVFSAAPSAALWRSVCVGVVSGGSTFMTAQAWLTQRVAIVASVCVAGALVFGPLLLGQLEPGSMISSRASMFVAVSAATFVLLQLWEAEADGYSSTLRQLAVALLLGVYAAAAPARRDSP